MLLKTFCSTIVISWLHMKCILVWILEKKPNKRKLFRLSPLSSFCWTHSLVKAKHTLYSHSETLPLDFILLVALGVWQFGPFSPQTCFISASLPALKLRVCMHTVSPIYTQGPSFIYLCWLSFFSSSLFYFLIFLLMHISSTY